MIYEEVFMGSRLEVRRHKDRQDPTNPRTEFVRICVPFNRQFSIVRTCKALYEESRSLYWCKTAVTCAYMSLQINLNAIPFYARPRIRVLDGVVTEDIFHPTNRMPLAQFLGHFPRLEYCQLHRQTVHMYCHQDDVPTEDFLARAGSDAIRNLASSLNADKPPVFLQRVYLWPQYDWDVSELYTPFISCFFNFPSQPQGPDVLRGGSKLTLRFFRRWSGYTSTIPMEESTSQRREVSPTKRASKMLLNQ